MSRESFAKFHSMLLFKQLYINRIKNCPSFFLFLLNKIYTYYLYASMHMCIHVDRLWQFWYFAKLGYRSLLAQLFMRKTYRKNKENQQLTPVEILFVSWKILLLVYACNVLFRTFCWRDCFILPLHRRYRKCANHLTSSWPRGRSERCSSLRNCISFLIFLQSYPRIKKYTLKPIFADWLILIVL